MTQYPRCDGIFAVHGPYYAEAKYEEYNYLYQEIAHVPTLEPELTWPDTAETDEKHKEQQYGLCPAADGLQNWACRVDGRYLRVYEVCPRSGDHAYHEHPVFEEFEKSAFHLAAKILFICDLRSILAHQIKGTRDETH